MTRRTRRHEGRVGGAAHHLVDGGDGQDLVNGNDGNDKVYGGAGDDNSTNGATYGVQMDLRDLRR